MEQVKIIYLGPEDFVQDWRKSPLDSDYQKNKKFLKNQQSFCEIYEISFWFHFFLNWTFCKSSEQYFEKLWLEVGRSEESAGSRIPLLKDPTLNLMTRIDCRNRNNAVAMKFLLKEDGLIVWWYPEAKFPYELTQPIPRNIPTEQNVRTYT